MCPGPDGVACVMIRNGLYHITVEMLDGIQGVLAVRDGTLRGGASPADE